MLPDNSLQHPQLDPRWTWACATSSRWANGTLVWRVGVDNVTDRRAWRESPFQFGHVYLFPLAPRTFAAVRCRPTCRASPRTL